MTQFPRIQASTSHGWMQHCRAERTFEGLHYSATHWNDKLGYTGINQQTISQHSRTLQYMHVHTIIHLLNALQMKSSRSLSLRTLYPNRFWKLSRRWRCISTWYLVPYVTSRSRLQNKTYQMLSMKMSTQWQAKTTVSSKHRTTPPRPQFPTGSRLLAEESEECHQWCWTTEHRARCRHHQLKPEHFTTADLADSTDLPSPRPWLRTNMPKKRRGTQPIRKGNKTLTY